MAIVPTQLARVSNLLRATVANGSIAKTQAQLLQVQNELSTGKRLITPSDDPGDAAIAQQLHKTLESRTAFLNNLKQAQSNLGEVDSTLGDLTDLLRRAQTIASASVGSDITPDQRASNQSVVSSIYSQALSLANKQFNGVYLFGGDASKAPYSEVAGGVRFDGVDTALANRFDENTLLSFGVRPSTVFGAYSPSSGPSADLSPDPTSSTLLTDLRGATSQGVRLGTIVVSDGTTTKAVDLTGASSLQDVVNLVNAAGTNVSATLTGDHLDLSAGATDTITVSDLGNGTAASDLGISGTAAAGAPLTGLGLSAKVTPLTQLSSLLGGAGLNTAGGLRITNGNSTVTVNFAGATTVEDLLNKINSAGVGALARVNAAGNGIEIINPVQGANLSVAENGGTLATTLGVRSFSPVTNLSVLNGGSGVNDVAGADFQITDKAGNTYAIDIAGASTVQDVLNAINAATGGNVTASFATTGNGIVLSDNTAGAGPLTVSPANLSTAARDLGIQGSTTGTAITGTDVNPVASPGIFGALLRLQTALSSSDQTGITKAAADLQAALDQVVRVRGQTGARVQELESRQERTEDQNVATKALLSQLEDSDYTDAITRFQTLQTALQANLATSAKILNQSLLDYLS